MLEITVRVEAPVEDAPGVKELLCMALETVPGAQVVRVAYVTHYGTIVFGV